MIKLSHVFTSILSFVFMVIFAACSPSEKASAQNTNTIPASAQGSMENAPVRDEAAFAKLLTPDAFNDTAPALFNVKVKTTKGDVKLELHRDWAPIGVDRFYNLVKGGFFSDIALFRMVKGFVVQFGIHGSPLVSAAWEQATIQDDPVRQLNNKGTITFATAGPNTRTTQLFINPRDNASLDTKGFAPIGKIIEGMDVIEKLNFEYAEKPKQGKIHAEGNAYLKSEFPNLDYIISMEVME